jgi:hypothetical protein
MHMNGEKSGKSVLALLRRSGKSTHIWEHPGFLRRVWFCLRDELNRKDGHTVLAIARFSWTIAQSLNFPSRNAGVVRSTRL